MAAERIVLVPAAGGGRRFGAAMPKQYALLAGQPVLARTLDRLAAALSPVRMFVALAPDDDAYERAVGLRPDVLPLRCGGATRAISVANALTALASSCHDDDWILVHDAARPCVPADALRRLVTEIDDGDVGGLLAVPVPDTLKREDTSSPGRVLRTEDRAGIWLAQTPQMFRYGILRRAFAAPVARTATDEAQAVEQLAATGACARPRLVLGSAQNVKLTYPADLALAEAIIALQERSP